MQCEVSCPGGSWSITSYFSNYSFLLLLVQWRSQEQKNLPSQSLYIVDQIAHDTTDSQMLSSMGGTAFAG